VRRLADTIDAIIKAMANHGQVKGGAVSKPGKVHVQVVRATNRMFEACYTQSPSHAGSKP
jgi:hypothetical protein